MGERKKGESVVMERSERREVKGEIREEEGGRIDVV